MTAEWRTELSGYKNVVDAALAETSSKFRLAEALATDIPERQRGPKNEASVAEHLAEARQAIIDAGGEPRSVSTLGVYRMTALWVSTVNGRNFEWVPDFSFTAHSEARAKGIDYDDFSTNPRTAREIRGEFQQGSKDGAPDKVISGWSATQRATAAKELLNDPAIVADVFSDDKAAQSAEDALDSRRERRFQESLAKARSQRQSDEADPEFRAHSARQEDFRNTDPTNREAVQGHSWAVLQHELTKANVSLAEVLSQLTDIAVNENTEQAEMAMRCIGKIEHKLDWIKPVLEGNSATLDDEIAEMLGSE